MIDSQMTSMRTLLSIFIVAWFIIIIDVTAWLSNQLPCAFLQVKYRWHHQNFVHSPSTYINSNTQYSYQKSNVDRCQSSSSLSCYVSSLNTTKTYDKDDPLRPPIAFRDESSYVLAGAIDNNTTIRQSPSSPYPLLSPPRAIPDPYGWMRDESRSNATVLSHLHAENEYTEQMTKHLSNLREQLYQEMLTAMSETDYTPPVAMGRYWYYERWEEGVSYPHYCRAPRNETDAYPPEINVNLKESTDVDNALQPLLPGEEVYLDVPSIAKNKTYLAVGTVTISPNQEYVAYSLDESGDEICTFHVRHIATGKESTMYDDNNRECKLKGYGEIEWDELSRGIFYVTMDETLRPCRVYYRRLFQSNGKYITSRENDRDEMLFEEEEGTFSVHIMKTCDKKYLLITSTSAESSEVNYIDLQRNITSSNLVCISPKKEKVLYRAVHCKGYWLLMTSVSSLPNFSLKACRIGGECNIENWTDVVLSETKTAVFDGGDHTSLDSITVFDPIPCKHVDNASSLAYVVASGREDGLTRVWILRLSTDEQTISSSNSLFVSNITRLEFAETNFEVSVGEHRDTTMPYVVVKYSSLVTPLSHVAVPLANPTDIEERRLLKESQVSGYAKDLYGCRRSIVKSRDGCDIPVSLVYRRDVLEAKSGQVPVHLVGYGSYGSCYEPSFRSTRLVLLNRNITYAIAHVRGGGENGRQWYSAPFGAKYLCKKNSFNDFIDVARWLTQSKTKCCLNTVSDPPDLGKGITNPSALSCEGHSAGGLLIGAAINQAPELFCAALMGVPFVDVLCTMTDATLPLTIGEWEEWGNPNEERYFDYINSYSPINNVNKSKVYPTCLLTGGLSDPRVQFWEPAKFAAELRYSTSKASGKMLLKMDMDAGHFSGHDRYKYLRDLSFNYAFIIDQLGIDKSNSSYK